MSAANARGRVNIKIKRRTDVVGIFPSNAAVIRLVGAVLAERYDEWQASRRHFSADSIAKLDRGDQEVPLLVGAA